MSSYESFPPMPVLSTNRLDIRLIEMKDAKDVFAIKSDPQVTERYGRDPQKSLDESVEFVKYRVADYKEHNSIFWVITIKDEDVAVGSCCFWNLEPSFRCAELGYELHRSYWNKGIMSEALPLIIDYGFTKLGLERIEAVPFAINSPSTRLLLKLGFKLEGTLRRKHFFKGEFFDQMYFGLLQEEWNERARKEN